MKRSELIAAAKSAIAAGNLDEAEKLTNQAKALKAVEDLETSADPSRLPFGTTTTEDDPPAEVSPAVKTWYIKRFGDLEVATEQVARELYDANYMQVAHAKHRAFKTFLRTGQADSRLARVILLTEDQILDAVGGGFGVGEIKATMLEAQDVLGGFLVPEDFRTNIIERLPGLTVVRPLASVITTSSDKVTMPKVTGGNSRYPTGVRVTWGDESPANLAGVATNATYGQTSIPIHVVRGKAVLTVSLVEDSMFNIESYLGKQFAIAMALDEDEQFLTGSGAGRPQGILNGVLANGAPFDSDITVVVSGSNSAVTADKVVAMPLALPAQYRQTGAVWVMNKDTRQALELLKDSQNRYLFSDNNNQLGDGVHEKLRGYTIKESEAMPAIAQNKYPIIFSNFDGYTIADRIGMSIERYKDSATAETDSIVFYARRRLGGQVTNGNATAVMKIST